jgi:uncharacterized protein (TIGR03435 family)
MNGANIFPSAGVVLSAILTAAIAQSTPKPAAFDVFSVHKSKSDGTPDVGPTADGYRATNVPILRLVATAFAPSEGDSPYFEYTRILGAPDWAKTDSYVIKAKVGESDLTEWQDPDSQKKMLPSMLQAMLAECCKLAVHREMKELPMYSLVITKNGPKLKDSVSVDDNDLRLKHPGGIALPGGGILQNGARQMSFFGTSMATLAEMLSTPAGRPVQDKTDLQGRYDFVLQIADPAANPGTTSPDLGPSPDDRLSIFTLMPEQLGLRLQPGKAQVETLVIDHIERPSEN